MPVITKTVGLTDLSQYASVWGELAAELADPKPFGQPLVTEEEFPRTGLIGVTVFWDRFDRVPDTARPSIIRKAYEVGCRDKSKRIAFANGYTVPEGEEAALLPYQVDLVITDQPPAPELVERCRVAMTELGGSTLANPVKPALRFPTPDQAVLCRDELVRRVPDSAGLWTIYAETRAFF